MVTPAILGSSVLTIIKIFGASFVSLSAFLVFIARIDAVFFWLCSKKWVLLVKLLLRFGANPNTWKRRGRTVLIEASAKGQGDLVLALLEKKADINRKDRAGFTALMLASKGGYSDTVDTLITKGADVNLTTRRGRTALIYAVQRAKPKKRMGKRDYPKTVNKLLNAGAKKLVKINGQKMKAIEFLPKHHILDDDTVRRLQ